MTDIHSCSPFCERPECVKARAAVSAEASSTPRTDAEWLPDESPIDFGDGWVPAEFSRQLERELAEAQQRIVALESMNENLASANIALAELRDTSSSEKDKFRDWLLEKAPDCGDNSCLFGGRGKGGMRTNGGCRCFKDVRPDMRRIFIERLWESFVTSATPRRSEP